MTRGPDRRGRKFPPLKADHWLVTEPGHCWICGHAFSEGDVTCLLVQGPGDEEEAAKAAAGRPYNAVAVPIHVHCPEPEG